MNIHRVMNIHYVSQSQRQLVGVVGRSASVRSVDILNIHGIMNIHDVGQLNRSWRILAANVHSGCKLLL